MRLKSAIALLLFGTFSYFGYGFIRTHTSGDVIAYKNFSRAVMRGDRLAAQRMVTDHEVLNVFNGHTRRMGQYRGNVRFTYHQILEQRYGPDGESVFLKVRQVTRMDPADADSTLWGSESIEEIHTVKLIKDNLVWRVAAFNDRFIGS